MSKKRKEQLVNEHLLGYDRGIVVGITFVLREVKKRHGLQAAIDLMNHFNDWDEMRKSCDLVYGGRYFEIKWKGEQLKY